MKIERFLTQTSPNKSVNPNKTSNPIKLQPKSSIIKKENSIQQQPPPIQQLQSNNSDMIQSINNKKNEEYETTINILKSEIEKLQNQTNEYIKLKEEHKRTLIPIITKLSIDRCSLRRKLNSESSYFYGYQTYVRRLQNVEDIWVEGEEYKELISEENRMNLVKDQRKQKKKKNVNNESDELCKIMNKKITVYYNIYIVIYRVICKTDKEITIFKNVYINVKVNEFLMKIVADLIIIPFYMINIY